MEEFGALLRTTAEKREAKDQYNNLSKKIKQYLLQEFYNPEDITILVRDIKYPITIIKTSEPTVLSIEDIKYPTIVTVQMDEIK